MALLVCTGCSTAYAVGLPRCPQCQSRDRIEEGQDMPKITVHGGATNSAVPALLSDGEHVLSPDTARAVAEPGYEDWTVEQLKDQLAERGLPKTGKRDDLVKRLVEDDAEKDTE
jgi:hypothetical protein